MQNNQTVPTYAKFLKLPVWWIVLTAAYIVLLYGFELLNSTADITKLKAQLVGLVGLFVPYGVFNSILAGMSFSSCSQGSCSNPIFLLVPFTLFVIFFSERFIKRWQFSVPQKIVFILVVLFLLTLLVDLATWHAWPSLRLFLTGDFDGADIQF